MDKGRFTPSVAKKLLRMLAGETVPSSSLPRWLAGELEGEGLLIPVTHGSRVSYRLTNVDVCRKFICDTYTSGTSLERWLEVADGEHATLERSMLVQETGNSKSIKLRTFCGFLVNSYEPIEAWMGDEAFLIAPSDGVALFIQQPDVFRIPSDVVVVGVENGEMVDLFWCVVAKHNIRTQNQHVPVIDLKRIEELFSSHSLNTVFHYIRNHEYEIKMPEDVSITHQEINYAGFKFTIPALCFGNTSE